MENVASIVNQVLDARGWRGKVLEQMAVEIWPEVVGDQIARNTIAQRFKNGTLYVRARSPQWTHELHFHEARVIARLNGRLRQNLVHKIRCSVTPPRGIKVGTHYTPLHFCTAFRNRGFKKGQYPVAESVAARLVTLPVHPRQTRDGLDYLIESIRAFSRTV